MQATAKDLDVALTIIETTAPGQLVQLAREHASSAGILVAVGGDGTVSDVITGSLGADVAIGIIPRGSTNMLAKELGIPLDVGRAVRVALGEGERTPIDIAQVNDTTCVHMAGAGFDAEFMRRTNPRWKRRVRWLAYLPAALASLRFPAFLAEIDIDGVRRRRLARVVLIALGSSIIHPKLRVGVGIDRTDHLIDVLVWDPPNMFAVLTCVGWIIAGRPNRSRWMRQARGKSISISADRAVPLEVDGDVIGKLPAHIALLKRQAIVLTPRC